jgi:hypothetical protein
VTADESQHRAHDGQHVVGAQSQLGDGLAGVGREWGERLHLTPAAPAQCPALSALLVRPDGFVAGAADGEPDPRAARAALTAWLGAPPAA